MSAVDVGVDNEQMARRQCCAGGVVRRGEAQAEVVSGATRRAYSTAGEGRCGDARVGEGIDACQVLDGSATMVEVATAALEVVEGMD